MTSAPIVAAVLAVLCAVLFPQVPQRMAAPRAILLLLIVVLVALAVVLP